MTFRTTHYNEKGKPPCTIIWNSKPNSELLAKVLLDIYYSPSIKKGNKTIESVKS